MFSFFSNFFDSSRSFGVIVSCIIFLVNWTIFIGHHSSGFLRSCSGVSMGRREVISMTFDSSHLCSPGVFHVIAQVLFFFILL